LNDLLQAQNTFLNVWVFYEAQRRNLDQDLGTIQVDAEGIWIDPGRISADRYLVDGQMLFTPDGAPCPTPFDLPPLNSAVPMIENESVSVSPNVDPGAIPGLGAEVIQPAPSVVNP